MPRQKTNTEIYWSNERAIEEMAAYLDFVPTLRYLADYYFNFRQHGRRLPREIKTSIINRALEWGWTPSQAGAVGGGVA